MDTDARFQTIIESALTDEPVAQTLLAHLLPPDKTHWQLREANPGTARQGRALLAYPTREDAELYLILTNPVSETDLPEVGNYLLEIMADTPDSGCELLVTRRTPEGFKVIYTDPDLLGSGT